MLGMNKRFACEAHDMSAKNMRGRVVNDLYVGRGCCKVLILLFQIIFFGFPIISVACEVGKFGLDKETATILQKSASGDVYCIPVSYLKDGALSHATPDIIWMELLWPELVGRPVNGLNRDATFLGDGKTLGVSLKSGVRRGDFLFNRMVGEYAQDGDSEMRIPSDESVPDDEIKKRDVHHVVDGLVTYQINYARVASKVRASSRDPADPFVLAAYNDWHIRRNESNEIETYIRCTTSFVRDADDKALGRAMVVPQCIHGMYFKNRRDMYLELRYRRSFLHDWLSIERSISDLIEKLRLKPDGVKF